MSVCWQLRKKFYSLEQVFLSVETSPRMNILSKCLTYLNSHCHISGHPSSDRISREIDDWKNGYLRTSNESHFFFFSSISRQKSTLIKSILSYYKNRTPIPMNIMIKERTNTSAQSNLRWRYTQWRLHWKRKNENFVRVSFTPLTTNRSFSRNEILLILKISSRHEPIPLRKSDPYW